MRFVQLKSVVARSALAASVLLLAGGAAYGQQQVNLTAGPATTTMPDGTVVPMWGYTCGAAVTGSTAACAALNPAVQAFNTAAATPAAAVGSQWSPIVITIPTGQSLQINLTNNLAFGTGGANKIPTSLTIVGQIGGGLGTPTTVASPTHNTQTPTWPIAVTGPTAPTFTPPPQGNRVQSFGTEVQAGASTPTQLTWTAPRPGTYLLESGTHPSIQGPMGLYGIVVVTAAPASTSAPGTAYPGVSYNADLPLVMSEIDPVQNASVAAAVATTGFNETKPWSGQPGACGNPYTSTGTANPTFNTCYPPAVDYTPTYYMFNGVAFNKTNAPASVFAASLGLSATPVTTGLSGNVLVRLVNAGLRMHVPSIVNATTGTAATPGMTLIAEDGNVLPGVPRVQSEVFLAAGKTQDVMINVPATTTAAPLPIFDRELSLSGNAVSRDAGMLAYLSVNGSSLPTSMSAANNLAKAVNDNYTVLTGVANSTVTVSDPTRGVIANDTNVLGVALLTAPTNGTVTLNANGTFTYTATGTATSDSFTYCANGSVTAGVCSSGITAKVTLAPSNIVDSGITCTAPTYTSNSTTSFATKSPGVLAGCKDGAGLPISVVGATPTKPLTINVAGGTVTLDVNGGFAFAASGTTAPAASVTFSFQAQNPQGTVKSAATQVTLTTLSPSNLAVTVLDGNDKKTVIGDYRWIIEEDRTFYVDPKCTTNPLPAGCPTATPQGSQFNYGTSFHTSWMPVIASGCTGALSCESGQKLQGVAAACNVGDGTCTTAASQRTASLPSQVHLDPTKRYYLTVLPGDAANPFIGGNLSAPSNCAAGPYTDAQGTLNTGCGHGMGGAPIGKGQTSVMVLAQPSPYPASKLTVYVFEDDYPLNGEYDAGGGVDVIAANEPGLGGFQVTLQDDAGATGDATGLPTYDMFNEPLSNSLAGTIDPVTGLDACPVSMVVTNSAQTIVTVSASLTSGSNTFTLASVPVNLVVGTPLTDSAKALPAGTTVTAVNGTTITLSANATATVTADTLTGSNGQKGITGMIVTCPKYESDGLTLSPLVGQAIVANLYPGRYGVQANAGADRIGRGEEWLQTNTLDGQKAHDSFLRIGEPAYFQEYGPAGYHVSIGFANPQIINNRRHNASNSGWCDSPSKSGLANQNGTPVTTQLVCNNSVTGTVTTARMSRTPDERLYGSGSRDAFAFTQCYAALSDPDGATFAFAKCDANGNFTFGPSSAGANDGIPAGNWMLTIFDQWNDQIVDGISTPVGVACAPGAGGGLCASPTAIATNCPANTPANTTCLGEIGAHQWQSNIYTRTFIDSDLNGVSNKDASGNATEPGLALVATNIRYRDGSFSNFNNTDLNGFANFNEVFPLFNWYVIETDTTRFKTTGVHVVYDAGGPADNSTPAGAPCVGSAVNPCGNSVIASHLANTLEAIPLPSDLRVPGAVYCSGADCTGSSIQTGPVAGGASGPACGHNADGTVSCASPMSTGRIDPPFWFGSYGWQGYSGQGNFLEFGKTPFKPGETGGIHGHVVYASTRPYDNPALLLQNSWEPLVPHVTLNLYKEGLAADGVTKTLTLIDTTTTTSWDDWAQGFRSDGVPNMNCAGQSTSDLFFYGLQNQPQWLDVYNNGAAAAKQLPYGAQFKCYDGMHTWNQLQPAPYDGFYNFPSVTGLDPKTGKPTGTNCTACVPNPDTTDNYRAGTPMLPAGTYVVEVVVPSGFELVKEEDKNILIGDNFIAPAALQFPGLSTNVFILPDQAAIGALYNPLNPQNSTQNLGRNQLPNSEGDTGSIETYWPCVGQARQVPDYISLFPQSQEVAPFAGAIRNLCDRKEITLNDQSSALAKFYVFTPAHIASHFTGIILDDFTSEFDPYSPQFGEKFAPSYLPVSIKDWTGYEISRVYSDQFGLYNGLSYSTWEVNPPNPTGYAPTMMITCMNDSGYGTANPWWDTKATGGAVSTTPDPFFQPGYSQFCYELAFMPGRTGYFDTPVTPNAAFTDGYNHPDCAYPTLTPAIGSVTSSDIAGPWVSAVGSAHTLTINALGDQPEDNYGYSGPSTTQYPFNQQKVTRHYGFGSATGSVALVGANGGAPVPLSLSGSWSDTSLKVYVPTTLTTAQTNSLACPVQQQAQYGGSKALCGQLVITTATGVKSVDTVTVTIGGSTPKVVGTSALPTIQSGIDAANPGDMVIVPPGVYTEMVVMWKPVRLQGVGAASSIVDSNTHPSAKLLSPWRTRINCLFGLTPDGRPRAAGDNSCASGWTGATGAAAATGNIDFASIIVDRLPFEAVLGWDATLNGNLAEQLIEPSLMGAYEGAAITVLGKGVKFTSGTPTAVNDAFGATVGAAFPANTLLLAGTPTSGDCVAGTSGKTKGLNPYPTNFYCNPSSIDGLGLRDSSQGGGGIYVHAYAHNLQIANNRIYNNLGTLSGGITLGQGEHPDLHLGNENPVLTYPPSCETSNVTNAGLPFCFNKNVNIHHNAITGNSSLGDELFSSTGAGAGGASINTGADYYQFTNNWVCGNLSSGDGGGVSHIGWIKNGTIANNQILFNKTSNPSIVTNGGGLLVMGAPDVDPTCGANNDQDCIPLPATILPSDGTGPNLTINANLILGNAAEAGSGGGLRLQNVNGTDVVNFPTGSTASQGAQWNSATVTNNIIVDNVAGWDGAGVSLQDALKVNIVNNTIASNDSTATAGPLFGSLFAPLSSAPSNSVGCTLSNGSYSCPQPSGIVSVPNSLVLQANVPTTMTCPTGYGVNNVAKNATHPSAASCYYYSSPLLLNDMIWQNRSFMLVVGASAGGLQSQQNLVQLMNASFTNPITPTAIVSQTAIGQCPATGSAYWDLGVRGDTVPTSSASGWKLTPQHSLLTPANSGYYAGNSNAFSDPALISQYCNGGRTPPEAGASGWAVPPGTNETNGAVNGTNPLLFTLTAAATVDEGNNWINMRWGPLSLVNPATYGGGGVLGNYAITGASGAIGVGTTTAVLGTGVNPPTTDYFGASRNGRNDAGAVQFSSTTADLVVTPTAVNFGTLVDGTTSAGQVLTLRNVGGAGATGITIGTLTAPFARTATTCGANLAAGASCTITVTFAPTTVGAFNATLAITASVPVTNAPVGLTGTGAAATHLASVTPTLAFGNWATGTSSNALFATVTNTGNSALAGGTFTLGGGTPQPFSRPAGTAGGTCGATLAVGASCTVGIQFAAPATAAAFSRTLTVAYTGATVTGSPVALTGTGVAQKGTVTLAPSPLVITDQSGVLSSTGTVMLTNSTAAGGSSIAVTNVAVNGAGLIWAFTKGTDNCTGANLAPGQSCTVTVNFTRLLSLGTHAGTITFTDTATTSPVGALSGVAQ